jgi:hypothetical protein
MLLALVLTALPLSAQQLRGRVVLADSVTPGAGVVIEAVLASDALVRARALASGNGSYVLQLPRPGEYRLTGLRIGYVPTEFGVISLAAGETRTQQLVMANTMVQLTVIRVDARAQCGRDIAGGSTVASLLTQVRAALGAATLVSTDGRPEAQWRTHRLIVDHRRVPLAGPWDSTRTGATQRPFASVSVMQLSNEGFVRFMEDGSAYYRAPDADVLLSEWFVSTHCFAVVEDREHPELIGLRFTPARVRAEITDIRGTLWLTREGTKLESLEFGYVGLPRYLDIANPGGSLRFAQLPDGSWIVRAWELRMPRAVRAFTIARPNFNESETPMVVASVEHVGGQVAKVQRGAAVLYEGSLEPLAAQFPALATPRAAPSCPAALAYDANTRGLVYGQISSRTGTLPANTRAEITWRAAPNEGLSESQRKQFRVLDAPDGFFMMCGLPFGSSVTVQAMAPGFVTGEAETRLGDRQRSARLSIVLEPAPTPP